MARHIEVAITIVQPIGDDAPLPTDPRFLDSVFDKLRETFGSDWFCSKATEFEDGKLRMELTYARPGRLSRKRLAQRS